MPDFIADLAAAMRAEPALFIALSALGGLMVGSFLNVVIHRLPRMMERAWLRECEELQGKEAAPAERYNLVAPRSACPHCRHPIAAWQNIPVLSYLLLRGKCGNCRTPIGLRYPLVELFSGLMAAIIAWRFGFSGMALAAAAFTFALIALACIDFDTQLLPDSITLPLLWLGLLFNFSHGFTDLHAAVAGAVAGYLCLWSVYWLFKLATGKEGMGYGDFKLLAAIGAWFGWQLLPAVILLSSLLGSIIGIGLIVLAKRGRHLPMPFGPYLALGGVAALFWGPQLSRFYLGV